MQSCRSEFIVAGIFAVRDLAVVARCMAIKAAYTSA